jgi:CubicO group peptidase (beta-lactamase class C family)
VSEARDCARSIIDQGTFGTGLQLVVRRGGRVVLNESFGEARPALPMTNDTIQALYCLTKPVVACAVCATVGAVGESLDRDLREVSPRLATLLGDYRVSLRDVLSHRAGLHAVGAPEAMFLPAAQRRAVTERATFADDWRVGVDRAYSDYQGWNVLRVWLEDVTRLPFGVAVREITLAPLGVDDCYFGFTDKQWTDVHDRLGLNVQLDNGALLPLLHGLLRKFLDDPLMQVIGGHASADAIASFYQAALDVFAGRPRPGLPEPPLFHELVQPTSAREPDLLLKTPVAFGLGFMVDLVDVFGATIGSRAFGHLGLMGNAFAFADPDLDLVVVFAANAVYFSAEGKQGIGKMRRSLVAAIYSDVVAAA